MSVLLFVHLLLAMLQGCVVWPELHRGGWVEWIASCP